MLVCPLADARDEGFIVARHHFQCHDKSNRSLNQLARRGGQRLAPRVSNHKEYTIANHFSINCPANDGGLS
jgi:hypothetical protein